MRKKKNNDGDKSTNERNVQSMKKKENILSGW